MKMAGNIKSYQIVLCGVGGQGILTITDIICNAALAAGWDVRGSETHGMAQRGGSVTSNIRIGDVKASLVPERAADAIISLEPVEALRYARFIKTGGFILFNEYKIPPPNINITGQEYPSIEEIIENIRNFTTNAIHINATKLAEKAGEVISQNIVMLGAFASLQNSPLTKEELLAELKRFIKPKFVEMNLAAFESGYQAALKML